MLIFMLTFTHAQDPGSPMAGSKSRFAMIVQVDPRSETPKLPRHEHQPPLDKVSALEIQTELAALKLRSLKFKY